ncbi:hypothetical protein A4A49_26188 [Nicotiana attenuata]|uniref:Uncharacterized protein n=1 Tax=Nicotiana attenuata TaxID=49451 RepID=A0A1J6IN26_NICAT|nr:hypothetical protein A4A49_26188 [Nicotiana attenuata]
MTANLRRNLTDPGNKGFVLVEKENQQPISVMNQPTPSFLPNAGLIPSQDKGPEEKLTYTKILTSNLPPEENPKDSEITETIQEDKYEEEEEDFPIWEHVISKKQKIRFAKGRNKNTPKNRN